MREPSFLVPLQNQPYKRIQHNTTSTAHQLVLIGAWRISSPEDTAAGEDGRRCFDRSFGIPGLRQGRLHTVMLVSFSREPLLVVFKGKLDGFVFHLN